MMKRTRRDGLFFGIVLLVLALVFRAQSTVATQYLLFGGSLLICLDIFHQVKAKLAMPKANELPRTCLIATCSQRLNCPYAANT